MGSGIGQTLREARAGRGIELDEAERVTKIRIKYLRAMEEDRWEVLPGDAYARGFLSTYASFLGLDHRRLVDEYKRGHEQVDEVQQVPQELPKRGTVRRGPTMPRAAVLVGLLGAAALGVVLILGLTGNSDDEAPDRNRARSGNEGGASTKPSAAAPRDAEPEGVSLRLRSTGTVWVCLVDDRDRALIDGQTLTVGEERGPFEAKAFEVTFGNGSVRLEVDDEPVRVPALAEPLGYRIASGGLSELGLSARPDCL
ncbi:MAG: helix-turn-helix domain-containing protein [Solirubrobacterales bacterium]